MATPHVFSSKGDIAYAELRHRILFGSIAAGSRLSQYDLAEELGISITPMREAIRRLSGEGLITLDTHRNARVAPMDTREARELFETRMALDPAAIALAAARRTDADIARMRTAADALRPITREQGEPALAAHRELHRAIYDASHNSVLIRLLDDVWDKSDRYRRRGLELLPGTDQSMRDFAEHGHMVELVIEQNAEEAAELMRSHIAASLTAQAFAGLPEAESPST